VSRSATAQTRRNQAVPESAVAIVGVARETVPFQASDEPRDGHVRSLSRGNGFALS
jgi:hypothetical protein